ncbi:hypothetical protein GCM10010305_24140 [Streptomyces termitum]|uniref:Uncharacterized protein n=1 Tax=Streptomyces termitum TaxID=67368 RepID=A0A918W9G4_9ACTN|nr:hypothetical protein GCM10010305_24140 [Streptomyces termitum]
MASTLWPRRSPRRRSRSYSDSGTAAACRTSRSQTVGPPVLPGRAPGAPGAARDGLPLQRVLQDTGAEQPVHDRGRRLRPADPGGGPVGEVLGALRLPQREVVQEVRDPVDGEPERGRHEVGRVVEEALGRPGRQRVRPGLKGLEGARDDEAVPGVAVRVVPELVAQERDPLLRGERLPQAEAHGEQTSPAHAVPLDGGVHLGAHRHGRDPGGADRGGDLVEQSEEVRRVRAAQHRPVGDGPAQAAETGPQQHREEDQDRAEHGVEALAEDDQRDPGGEQGEGEAVHGQRERGGEPAGAAAPGGLPAALLAEFGEELFPVAAGEPPPQPLDPAARPLVRRARIDVPVACRAPGDVDPAPGRGGAAVGAGRGGDRSSRGVVGRPGHGGFPPPGVAATAPFPRVVRAKPSPSRCSRRARAVRADDQGL